MIKVKLFLNIKRYHYFWNKLKRKVHDINRNTANQHKMIYLLYLQLILVCFCSLERTLVVNGTEVIMESKIMVVMGTVHHKVKIPCMLLEQLMGHPPIAMGTTNSQLAEL